MFGHYYIGYIRARFTASFPKLSPGQAKGHMWHGRRLNAFCYTFIKNDDESSFLFSLARKIIYAHENHRRSYYAIVESDFENRFGFARQFSSKWRANHFNLTIYNQALRKASALKDNHIIESCTIFCITFSFYFKWAGQTSSTCTGQWNSSWSTMPSQVSLREKLVDTWKNSKNFCEC